MPPRSSPCARSATASMRAIRSRLPGRPALAADRLGGGGDARLRGRRVRRRLHADRDRAARPDRPRHRAATRASSPRRCGPLPRPDRRQRSPRRPRRYVRDQPYTATSTLLFVLVPGARRPATTPRCSAPRGPTTARRRPSRRTRTRSAIELRPRGPGSLDPPRPRRRPDADPRAPDLRSGAAGRRSAPASRWRSSSAPSTASPGRSCSPGCGRAGARADRLLPGRRPRHGAAAADGRRRRPRRRAATSSRGWRSRGGRATRSGCWPSRSTTCSTGSPRRSPASASSSPTPRTSCARRSP